MTSEHLKWGHETQRVLWAVSGVLSFEQFFIQELPVYGSVRAGKVVTFVACAGPGMLQLNYYVIAYWPARFD